MGGILLLDAAGATAECKVTLNRELTDLSLSFPEKMDAKEQRIRLREIERIYLGEETINDVDLSLRELCVTLLLEDGRTLRLLFGSGDERDAFAFCLTMFVADTPAAHESLTTNPQHLVNDWERPMRLQQKIACG